MSIRRPDPDWFATLRTGDVLRSPSGSYRVVRLVSRKQDGRLSGVVFAIRRRSWTGRPVTTYMRAELHQGWSYVGARVKLTTELDQQIAHCATYPGRRSDPCGCALTPEDVRGIA